MKKILKEWFISAPWGKIAVVSWGDPSKKPLLLVHGRLDSVFTFYPLIDLLPDVYHFVGFDLPGNGKSDALPFGLPTTGMTMLYAIELVVQDLGWQHFEYIGHSMGGEFGMFYAILHPNQITRLIQIDSVPIVRSLIYQPWPEFYAHFHQEYYINYKKYNQLISEKKSYTKQKALETIIKARKVTRDQAALLIERNLRQVGEDEYKLHWDPRLKNLPPLTLPPQTLIELFINHSPPTLSLITKTSLKYFGPDKERAMSYLELFTRKCKDFEYKLCEGGHDLHLTEIDVILNDVKEFLVRDFSKTSRAKL